MSDLSRMKTRVLAVLVCLSHTQPALALRIGGSVGQFLDRAGEAAERMWREGTGQAAADRTARARREAEEAENELRTTESELTAAEAELADRQAEWTRSSRQRREEAQLHLSRIRPINEMLQTMETQLKASEETARRIAAPLRVLPTTAQGLSAALTELSIRLPTEMDLGSDNLAALELWERVARRQNLQLVSQSQEGQPSPEASEHIRRSVRVFLRLGDRFSQILQQTREGALALGNRLASSAFRDHLALTTSTATRSESVVSNHLQSVADFRRSLTESERLLNQVLTDNPNPSN